MRLHVPLDDLLTGSANLRALRWLVRNEGRQFTGRELAGGARLSPSQAQTALLELERQGMAHRRVVGRSFLWRLEDRNELLRALKELLTTEEGLMDALGREIAGALQRTPATRATLFGSTVRGEERPDSDIDLWVEVPRESDKPRMEEALFRLRDRIGARFGNPLSSFVKSHEELEHPASPSLLEEVRGHGRLVFERGSG
ncbi:MAG: nucleotidyltransferase domain-containing protein [Euryarchaeota archaeon]|nr:nucleotidyltransferase domain-containing protein [Euryarchaeota archaeon]MDE2046584.1 nucleotidyltransferase domain-containing protein [Thermoplasmata archaeon]